MHLYIIHHQHEVAEAKQLLDELASRFKGTEHGVELKESAASKLELIGSASESTSPVEFGFSEIIPIWLDDENSE